MVSHGSKAVALPLPRALVVGRRGYEKRGAKCQRNDLRITTSFVQCRVRWVIACEPLPEPKHFQHRLEWMTSCSNSCSEWEATNRSWTGGGTQLGTGWVLADLKEVWQEQAAVFPAHRRPAMRRGRTSQMQTMGIVWGVIVGDGLSSW